MAENFHVPDSEVPFLQKTYSERYESLTIQLTSLAKQIELMTPMLIQLGIIEDVQQAPTATVIGDDGYNPSWKWLQKIEFLLNLAMIPKTSTEIVEEIVKREPKESRSRVMNSVPATLSTAANNVFTNVKRKLNAKGEYEYWIDNLPF